MDTLIPVISKLQDVFSVIGSRNSQIQLPQIAVVGSQVSHHYPNYVPNTHVYLLFFSLPVKAQSLKELLDVISFPEAPELLLVVHFCSTFITFLWMIPSDK